MQFILRQIDFIPLNSIDKDRNLSFFKGFLNSFFAFCIFFLLTMPSYAASPDMKRVVALGDSLTSGYGLESGDSFPAQLEKLLIADGFNVVIDNAGVSGDTSAGGLARVEWAIDGDVTPSLVIVALGANDMLRGLPIEQTKSNLASIIEIIQKRKIPILLVGMKSPLNYPTPFIKKFDGLYEELSEQYDIPLYPFFLEGVALKSDLNQADGIHPNVEGIKLIANNLLPQVKEILE
jgi:acyl-CoA thioesterase-1